MEPLRLFATFARVAVMNELVYRANFLIQLVQSLISLGAAVVGLELVFYHTTSLGGWREQEILVLLGVFLIMRGLINMLIIPGLERLIDDIHLGSLDFLLTKPQDAQLLVSIRQLHVWQSIDFLLGAGTVLAALSQLGRLITPMELLLFVATLAVGTVIIYCFLLALATTAFWFVRVENLLTIFRSVYEVGRWPVDIYPPWLGWLLTFLVPVTVAVTIPAESLTGRITWPTLAGVTLLAAGLLYLARRIWHFGLQHYAGASA
jgi:ABC-2 type transport system permease protein